MVPSANAENVKVTPLGGQAGEFCRLDRALVGVVTLSEIGPIWATSHRTKSLKTLMSKFAIVGEHHSI